MQFKVMELVPKCPHSYLSCKILQMTIICPINPGLTLTVSTVSTLTLATLIYLLPMMKLYVDCPLDTRLH